MPSNTITDNNNNSNNTPIQKIFQGKNILVTGGTGFIGMVLIEKLLRDCGDLQTIHMIVRPNKGKQPEERVKELFSNVLFSKLLEKNPSAVSKVNVIQGDLSKENMGIESQEQLEQIKTSVSFVFNCAANVKFNDRLDKSLNANVVSLHHLLRFAHTMTSLKSFIHLSTAYSQCHLSHIEEKFYPSVADPMSLIQTLETMTPEDIEKITPVLMGQRPNTYTLTKSIAEALLSKESAGLPVALIRPSIVGGLASDPLPGWSANLNGPSGIYVAAGNGFLKAIIHSAKKGNFDLIPVEYCVNMMIAVAWKLATNPVQEPIVYNCVSSSTNPLSFELHRKLTEKMVSKHGKTETGRKRSASLSLVSESKYKLVYDPLLHQLPASIYDTVRELKGQDPVAKKAVKRLNAAVDAFTFFTTHSWEWEDENAKKLIQELSESDKVIFNMDLTRLDWKTYLKTYYVGSLKYLHFPLAAKRAALSSSSTSALSSASVL